MGPGQAPHTQAESLQFILEYRSRLASALDPYLDRAIKAQLEVTDALEDDGNDVLSEKGVNLQKSVNGSALVELVADVLHYCIEQEISFINVQQAALQMQGKQTRQLTRHLVYAIPDEPDSDDGGDVWLSR